MLRHPSAPPKTLPRHSRADPHSPEPWALGWAASREVLVRGFPLGSKMAPRSKRAPEDEEPRLKTREKQQ
eukprot:6735033-Pyramimonas_sp.AAC.1